jgi:hypothetical protein
MQVGKDERVAGCVFDENGDRTAEHEVRLIRDFTHADNDVPSRISPTTETLEKTGYRGIRNYATQSLRFPPGTTRIVQLSALLCGALGRRFFPIDGFSF